jgi:uncharacterized membrane protein
MHIEEVKFLYVFACSILLLVVLLPTFIGFFSTSVDEEFSELWVLGSNRMIAANPITISANEPFKAYLGVGNYMGKMKYYTIYVKLRNQTESFPNSTGFPSSLEPIFEYRLFLKNDATWERELSFSFNSVSFEGNSSSVSGLSFNGNLVDVHKVAAWDAERRGFFYQLFFELWIYDPDSGFEYHNRSVGLWFNMSS